MSTPQPIRILWDECWNQRELHKLNSIISPDLVLHAFGNDVVGIEPVYHILSSTIAGFSDIHQYLDECFSTSEGIVTTCWHGEGTHDGVYNDIEPTGRHFEYCGITVFRIDNDKIVEAWFSSNEAAQLELLKKEAE